jgi:3-hydroxymyristoyl/3-hydroxydecanoyl-(acyl carrier protein) dehydratase
MQEFDLDRRSVSLPDADQSFPRVLSLTGDETHICARLDISPNLGWFRGHFPDQPVLPGVVQLHWAVLFAQACFGFTAVPTEIKRLKFKKIVMPPQELELTVSKHGSGEVQFEFSSPDATNSEGRLVFGGALPC